MQIEVQELAKEFNYTSVFENITDTFFSQNKIAVLGENGSGKSTFLKVLAGMVQMTAGKVHWIDEGKSLPQHLWYQYFAYASPQLFFGQQLTVLETLEIFMRMKPFQSGINPHTALAMLGFEAHRDKFIHRLSSGMYQRIRLILTICAQTPVLFLDEPCSNLDAKGVTLYRELIDQYANDRLVFVASNDEREYSFCSKTIQMADYK